MQKFRLVFVDDSGDPDPQNTSTKHLVMAAVIFDSPTDSAQAAETIRSFKKQHKMRPEYELKFYKLKKSLIREVLHNLNKIHYRVVIAYINKKEFRKAHPRFQTKNIYNWFIGELLRQVEVDRASVHIDGRANHEQIEQATTYLRKELRKYGQRAKEIVFEDSKKVELIQMADLIAGSARRYLDASKTDYAEYINILQPHIDNMVDLI